MITQDKLLIGGQWVKPAGSGTVDIISPITEAVFGRMPESTPADIDAAVAAARKAFDEGPWPRMTIAERAVYVLRIAELLEPHLKEATDMQINEMGGPRKFIEPATVSLQRQVQGAIAMAQSIPTREVRDGGAGKIVVFREPLGVIGSIMPWNAPFVGLMGRLTAALLTGNVFIIKPAPEAPLNSYLIADAVARSGLPAGVVSIVPGGREVGQYLVSHPGVDKVSFTGSTAAGRIVGRICGENIKPVTLELGGKSAGIVLDDVDLAAQLPAIISASLANTGQICVATTRILAPMSRYKEVVDGLVSSVSAMKVGNPLDADADFGPLVAERQRERVEGYIKSGLDDGAKLVLGGGRPAINKGWYVEPTIFTDVDNGMKIAQEEIFGPVLAVIPYGSVDEAISIANDSTYGLGGGVFTSDIERGLDVASRIRTGSVQINNGPFSGGGGPFGGYKQSGIGRVFGREGMQNHYQLKSVSLPPGVQPA